MAPVLLNLALFVSLCSGLAAGKALSGDALEEQSRSGSDAALMCTARKKPEVQYRAVRWYKVGEDPEPRLSGLVTRDLMNGTTRWYLGLDREVQLQDSLSIFLPNVSCSDAGLYECHLAAPVGEQNREGRVLLTLADCAETPEKELITDTSLVISASAVLMLALLIFFMSYGSLKTILKDRSKPLRKEILLNAPLKPLDQKDLMLIYTLGPKTSSMKHVCV